MLAHILPNNAVPDALQWTVIAIAAVGAIGVLRRRRPLLDAFAWTAFGAGTAAIVVMVGIGLFAPQPPGYALSFAAAPGGASPLRLSVCAQYPNGSYTRTPQHGDVLAVLIDGQQSGYFGLSDISVPVAAGRHTVKVELLTSEHREFNPAVATQTSVTVTAAGARTLASATCPGSLAP